MTQAMHNFDRRAFLSRPTVEDAQNLETAFYRVLVVLLAIPSNGHLRKLALKAVSDAVRLASFESLSPQYTGNDRSLFGGGC